ncbi:GM16321 [Drosophila sechellia]|uniref:GD18058 n=2 Tax=melanogaster subgroup TaxID=32351 RepID=B4QY42_DROSI|nr:GM16321 [Drosophila sechellia]EDX14690.1 GD18058 [Drosophila simulans]
MPHISGYQVGVTECLSDSHPVLFMPPVCGLYSTLDLPLAACAYTYVVAWKRGIAILTAGSVKVTPDPRVRLVNGFNLQIRDALPTDAGDYICQIATMDPREITHTVEILGK